MAEVHTKDKNPPLVPILSSPSVPPLHMEICSFGPSLCISFRGGEVVSELFSMSSIDIPPRSGRLQSSNLSGKGWFTFSALITFCSEHLPSVKARFNAKQTLMRQVLVANIAKL